MDICKVCGKLCNNIGCHVKAHKMTSKQYYDVYFKKPEEGKCKTCNKPTNFLGINRGYQIHCSNSCTRLDPNVKLQIEETHLKKYGVRHIFLSTQVKEKSHSNEANIKRKTTCIKHFGVEHQFASKEIQNKSRQTCLKKYGVPYAASSLTVKQKISDTCFNKYGVPWATQSSEVIDKMKHTLLLRYGVENSFQIPQNIPIMQEKTKKTCMEKYGVEYGWHKPLNIFHSKYETLLYNDIQTYYNGEILLNYRKLIYPLEVDIYLPELSIAVEFNGTYWHSVELGTLKDYHLNKSLMCREKTIRLIHIYEFEDFEYQKQLLKDLILGQNNYPINDFNKNNLLDNIPEPEIIFSKENCTIYGAGKLY